MGGRAFTSRTYVLTKTDARQPHSVSKRPQLVTSRPQLAYHGSACQDGFIRFASDRVNRILLFSPFSLFLFFYRAIYSDRNYAKILSEHIRMLEGSSIFFEV